MNVLVLGSGGREHAIIWKIKQSALTELIYCIPGNAGISDLAECHNISLSNFNEISDFVEKKQVDLTIVGPEQPLVEGIVDYLESRNHLVFGPDAAAAQLEGSKIYAKNFMRKYDIPTAEFGTFFEYQQALNYLDTAEESKIVVKADGLAAGKGSVICDNLDDAKKMIRQMMVEKQFAEAGQKVVIEEFMQGEEASFFVLTDGKDFKVLSCAQDFKRALDNDGGLNTGGMGSYAPTPVVTDTIHHQVIHKIVEPVLSGLGSEGIVYKGMLYVGLMLTEQGPKVVEFNCRFGDPETQVVLPLLKSDLMELLLACARGQLAKETVSFHEGYAVCVIAASGGYPGTYQKGKEIMGLEHVDPEVLVFHAGTRKADKKILTNGGRVLGVTAVGDTLASAIEKVYHNIENIYFDGIQYRTDIAKRALKLF